MSSLHFHGKARQSSSSSAWYFDGAIVLAQADSLALTNGQAWSGEWLLVYLGQGATAWIDARKGKFPAPRIVPTTAVLMAENY